MKKFSKKFFMAIMMVIVITMGLVNQAFAETNGESFDKFEILKSEYARAMAYNSEAENYTLVSQRIVLSKCFDFEKHDYCYDYVWEVEAYDHELNQYISDSMWIGSGEELDYIIETLKTL